MHRYRSKINVAIGMTLAAAAIAALAPAASAVSQTEVERTERDWELPVIETAGTAAISIEGSSLDVDPHGLVPKFPFVKRYSLDADQFEVWLCGPVSHTMDDVLDQLEGATVDYYAALSHGVYEPTFTAGGSLPNDPYCVSGFFGETPVYTPAGKPEALIIIDTVTGGGFATPGPICNGDSGDCPYIQSTFPANGRYAIVGENVLFNVPAVATHEIGHTLHWPHSYSGLSTYEYDNPIDVMSGNSSALGTRQTEPAPYATLSYNRYQSGWVSADDVVVATSAQQTVTLEPYDVAGTQLLVVKTGNDGQFYALGARKPGPYDPIPQAWAGVEVYFVDHDCAHPLFGSLCPGLFREHHQEPPNEYQLDHVLTPGDSVELNGIRIEVAAATATGFVVVVSPGGEPRVESGTFLDDDGSIFEGDIEWLAAAGITTGCNPPIGNLFCPNETVTRGQMAAFLARALALQDSWAGRFVDDDGSVFEADIEEIAAVGITAGCNPPVNDQFCPDTAVTRGEMAAFLVRALDLPAGTHPGFVDDNGSIFEGDIGRLAVAGITAGCNPPENDRLCPKDPVTRGEMAAFLHRALEP